MSEISPISVSLPSTEFVPQSSLMSMRASTNTPTGLTPHEVVTGRPMRVPGAVIHMSQRSDLAIMGESMSSYCQKMTHALQCAFSQVKAAHEEQAPGDNREYRLTPGDRLYIKIPQAGLLGRHWSGPHTALLTATAAVKTTASPRWVHTSHVKRDPAA